MVRGLSRIQELEEQVDLTREVVAAAVKFWETPNNETKQGVFDAVVNYRKYVGN